MSLPNFYQTTLAQSLSAGGSNSEIFVNSITTPDGQTIAITDFVIENQTGFLIIDPQSSANVEYISFTGVSSGDVSFTGATRGLSFKGDGSSVAANKLFHAAGATVIIGWSSNDLANFVNRFTPQTIYASLTFATVANTPILASGTKSGNQAVSFNDVAGMISGSVGTASTLVFGTVKISVDPASVSTPIAVGNNDPRVPTQAENDALVGNNGNPSSTNTFITQTGFQKGSEIYGADSVGTDAYAITVSPAISSYTAGMRFFIKIGTANTGAATLAVGSGAAKDIRKNYNAALVTGDLLAGQIIEVSYDVTNDFWQLLSPVSQGAVYQSGTFTHDMSNTASNVIAHGLGVTPKFVRTTMLSIFGTSGVSNSVGVYNGSTVSTVVLGYDGGGNSINVSTDSTNVVSYITTATANNKAALTINSTSLTYAWTKTGSPTGTPVLLWEAWS